MLLSAKTSKQVAGTFFKRSRRVELVRTKFISTPLLTSVFLDKTKRLEDLKSD
jgi:hypothetical protein